MRERAQLIRWPGVTNSSGLRVMELHREKLRMQGVRISIWRESIGSVLNHGREGKSGLAEQTLKGKKKETQERCANTQ